MTEAEAELAFDAREVLHDTSVPVVLVGGDEEPHFSKKVQKETVRLISDSTLRMDVGQGER